MRKNNRKLFVEWFQKGDEDEKSIEAILRNGGAPSTACFLSQQMAEKYLKGFCVYSKIVPPKIHDLIAIAGLLEKSWPGIKNFKKQLVLLNKYYITTRYPADVPEFTREQAEDAFRAAREVKKFIMDKI